MLVCESLYRRNVVFSGARKSKPDGVSCDDAELLTLATLELLCPELTALLLADEMVTGDEVAAADELVALETARLEALLLTSGLLITALLGVFGLSSAGAPPQADSKTGNAIKNAT